MTSTRMPWFRMYADFLNDPKLVALAFEDQRHFIGLLALKCDGALDGDIDPILLDRIVAQRLWIDHAVIRDVKRRLVQAGLIGDDWQPLGWEKRQFQSDSSSERVRRFRERKQQSESRNHDETLQQRFSNVIDTDTDTDTDTEEKEKEKKEKPPARCSRAHPPQKPDDVDLRVWADWLELRKAKRAPVTQTVLDDAQREAAKAGMTLEAFLREWCSRGSQGLKAEWLSGKSPPQAGGFVNKQEALEARNRAVAAEWVKEMEAKYAAG